MSNAAARLLLPAIAFALLPGEVRAQKILLQLRPRVGDTVVMRLDQQTEVIGKREPKSAASTSAATASSSMTATSVTFSRAVVESAVAAYTKIVAITDSVLMSNTDQRGQATSPAVQHRLEGQRIRLTIAPDGSI